MRVFSYLPRHLIIQISEFLSQDDTICFSDTDPNIKGSLGIELSSLKMIHEGFDPDENTFGLTWSGPQYDDGKDHIWLLLRPLISKYERVHSVQLQCRCKDQSWGNRKGQLIVRQHEENILPDLQDDVVDRGEIVTESPIIDHDWRFLTLEFVPRKGRTNYSIDVRVGGGGGHALNIINVIIHVLFYN